MRILLILCVCILSAFSLRAEQISDIEVTNSWIYLYNAQGKKFRSLSVSTVGNICGFSSSFFVSEKGSWIYLWNADGKKINSLSKSSVGEVISVAGDTFTSKKGNWIYTWTKEGKKINSRSAH